MVRLRLRQTARDRSWASVAALLLGASLLVGAPATCASQPELPDWARPTFERRGFAVMSGGSAGFVETYDRLADSGLPPYVTADIVLYGTAAVLDRTLAELESGALYGRLADLSFEMIRLSEEQFLLTQDPLVREAARLNMAYFAVGLSLLDSDYFPPESVRGLVERELALIEEGDAVVFSPILGPTPLDDVVGPGEDYSHYRPSGRYADDERLSRFYRAATWYGRMAFALPEGRFGDYELTRQALLLVKAIESESGEWLELWERVQEPLAFFYGDSEDPTLSDYSSVAAEVFGDDYDIELLADDLMLEEFTGRVSEMAPAHVETHELRGLRFLVRRFPPDIPYLYGLARSDRRELPTTLDIMAVLDSRAARDVLVDERGEFDSEIYRRVFDSIELELEALTYGDWTRNVYWSWLYALRPLLEGPPADGGYVTENGWDAKQLSTACAAWALMRNSWGRHGGEGGADRLKSIEEISCLVEPYPQLYARLVELLDHVSDRLLEHYLLSAEIDEILDVERRTLRRLESAAEAQLGGKAPTCLPSATARPASALADIVLGRTRSEREISFCSTVYRDHVSGSRLIVVVGRPDVLYVMGPGGTIYAGAVFSFYEFEGEAFGPGRHEDWLGKVYDGTIERPEWTSRFLID